jgi:coatomer subunit beta'
MRVYNYNTSEKVTSFEAHPDYIRAIAVHPTQPFVLTASVSCARERKRNAELG